MKLATTRRLRAKVKRHQATNTFNTSNAARAIHANISSASNTATAYQQDQHVGALALVLVSCVSAVGINSQVAGICETPSGFTLGGRGTGKLQK